MSIAVEPEDVTDVAPEFASTAEESIELFIEQARIFVNESVWGEKKGKAGIIYMACHMMKEMGLGSGGISDGAGAVTQEKVGDLSKSYGDLGNGSRNETDKILMTTKYGKMFLLLKKTLVITPMVT